jgi:hypothetical protein
VTWTAGQNDDRIVTVPIVDDGNIESLEAFELRIYTSTGAGIGTYRFFRYDILDNDGPGTATFGSSNATVKESDGQALLTVRRGYPYATELTFHYATAPGSATPPQDYTHTTGTLTWAPGETADQQIAIPLTSDIGIEGDETFTVTLSASDTTWLGAIKTATVTIKDAPYQQWLKTYWPGSVPDASLYNDFPTAIRALSPLFHLRLSESAGASSTTAVDAGGNVLFSAPFSITGSGNFSLGAIGPRPTLWLGLETTNSAASFTASLGNGASAHLGTAAALGSKLGQTFTISAFVRTTENSRVMTLLGGQNAGTTTQLQVLLNNSATNTGVATADHVRLVIRSEGNKTLSYSVRLAGLPTGQLTDGQWHHLVITVPLFTAPTPGAGGFPQTANDNTDFPRFCFDGAEANVLEVRGTENIGPTDTFADFTDGLRLGAAGQPAGAAQTLFFAGSLDEVAVFPRILSAAEITSLNAARPPSIWPAQFADNASPANDGIDNLTKYALGLNPLVPATGGLPTLGRSGSFSEFSFTRMRDATDITYRLERSPNLAPLSWQEIWNSTGDPYPGTAPSFTETMSVDEGILDAASYRLRITRP